MDIICDTNIWYNIAYGTIDVTKLSPDTRLIANYNNICEFVNTHNLLGRPDDTRKAIQSMFVYSKDNAIYDPPLIHIKKLAQPDFKRDLSDHLDPMLEFTERVANGDIVDVSKEEEFKDFTDKRKADLQKSADAINEEALIIKEAVKNKKEIKKEDRISSSRKLISFFVSVISKDEGLPEDFDWTKIELFESVLLEFFIKIEKGAMVFTANDWFDLFLLAYVQPDKKVWTKEKKWIQIIDDAGMTKYRFDN